MANITSKLYPIKVTMNGIHFRTYAVHYLQAVQMYSVIEGEKLPFDPIPYQLICQSIELHLKSFIWMKEKYDNDKFKKEYGHNIIKLWNHCKKINIDDYIEYDHRENSVIEQIGNEYKKRKFCYLDLDMAYEVFPVLMSNPQILETLVSFSEQLTEKLKKPLYGSSYQSGKVSD